MLDVSVSYNRYKFLGYEYLTWLWFAIENEPETVVNSKMAPGHLEIGNRVVLENRYKDDVVESITIKGDDAGLEEGMIALKKGAMMTELNLVYTIGDKKWQFTVKGESFHLTNIKLPEVLSSESNKDIEGIILDKADLCEFIFKLLDESYQNFIRVRISPSWQTDTIPKMRHWIKKVKK